MLEPFWDAWAALDWSRLPASVIYNDANDYNVLVDPAGSREIRDLILNFKSRGITILLCSHLLGQVQEICDRSKEETGLIHEGHVSALGQND